MGRPISLDQQRAIGALGDRIARLDEAIQGHVRTRRSELAEEIKKDERFQDLASRPKFLVSVTAGARRTAREGKTEKKRAEAILWLRQERTRRREEFQRVKKSLREAFTEETSAAVPAAREIVTEKERRFQSWPPEDVIEDLIALVRNYLDSTSSDNRKREAKDVIRNLVPALRRYVNENDDPVLVDHQGRNLAALVLDLFETIQGLDSLGASIVEELAHEPELIHESLLFYLDDVQAYAGQDSFKMAARLHGIALAQEDDQPPDPDAEIAKRIIAWGRDGEGNLITREEAEKDWVESHHKTREEEEREAYEEAERLVQDGRRVFHGGGDLFGSGPNPLSTPMKRARTPTGGE
ncbi:hypothetical protein AMJ39_08225 [candidate division TA06 bacterium DG_24]|uniref:Uncharacterized protein n=1 Tax=candidate division TA06 bacterium DG_24 TaxID=1703770 RepID=A0A0S7WQ63_UNCT6|nr:MAG: hypothetical protein AMJ39_08225 [candidate division TA06 bacterium DG_24]